MDQLQEHVIDPLSTILYSYVLIYLLIGAGLYFTLRTRAVQVRLFGTMLRLVGGSRGEAKGGISSFQAFCVGLASRIGTGNIAGVAIALTLGGPGAIFWMWVVALVGMATAFVESTLAQMFKVRAEDGSFRGGPAYYIQRGLRSRRWGVVFALLLIFAFGFAFNMVQANTISDVLSTSHGVSSGWTAVLLMVLAAPILYGGVRRVATFAGVVLPVMALVYVGLALVIIVLNLGAVPDVLRQIVEGAFGLDEALAGTAGGILAALLNGVKRGLFSNEAGMGSAPNAAATATVSHPAKQGLIQSLGVFVDTIVVCSATAFIILVAGPSVYDPGATTEAAGASLTQAAVAAELGTWTTWPMTILIAVFAFSSVVGNYSYAEVNLTFLGIHGKALTALRTLVLAAVGVGSLVALEAAWALADVAMALMAIVNLVAIALLGRWAFGALRDFEAMRRAGRDDPFVGVGNPHLPGDLPGDVWSGQETSHSSR
ncbi:AGCS family alanine or glycine:cation symporter [Sediminihabitans luteus]|uniref:AGCS family alanine or glycine:cation symporter n=1 Tax=Sediminihabitans luteus TaxID=1138585 RepID=A0A2M9CPF5_9CELL|nr:alanine/glycine:cation symporter family protein [Sediminihabitans luteus]PJJ73776.1 AGCS family alanine or glycine:cation symporter [Sediminihabitans luteus]GIJ00545.1 sodium:alanine symporter [Sediminihabitans luteus]